MSLNLVTGGGPGGENAWVYNGTGAAAPAGTHAGTVQIPVTAGEQLCLSGYIDATNVTLGSPAWEVWDPTLTTLYCSAAQVAGSAGTVSANFVVPTGLTRVRVLADVNAATVVSGQPLTFSSPQLEEGHDASDYNENLNDELNTSGGTEMLDPTNLAYTIDHKSDLILTWQYPSTPTINQLPIDFKHFAVYIGTTFATATLVHNTEQFKLKITDPAPGTNTYWVAVFNDAGAADPTPPSVVATLAAIPDVTGLAAVITKNNDIKLSWTAPATLPPGFSAYEIRSGASWAAGTLVDRTKKSVYLITDPPNGSPTYWVGVLDRSGNYDATPPSVAVSFTAQPYTLKTVLGADVGPFRAATVVIGPVSFTVPPAGGRLHVDWTMLLTNGATSQIVLGYVEDTVALISCALHRTKAPTSGTHGFNGSGHFNRYYSGGTVLGVSLICQPASGANCTVNAVDGTLATVKTFLDIQFHPSPN